MLENKLKELEDNLNTEDNIRSYNAYKKYEHGEKSTKFFLNLEKKRGNQNQIRRLIIDKKEIDGDVEIF